MVHLDRIRVLNIKTNYFHKLKQGGVEDMFKDNSHS